MENTIMLLFYYGKSKADMPVESYR